MQYQPGSWYLPWGVPLQKMLTMSFPQAGTPNVNPYAPPNSPAITCQVLSNQHQNSANVQNATIQMQSAAAHSYQHTTVGAPFPCANTGVALHHNGQPQSAGTSLTATLLNSHAHSIPHGLQNSHQLSNTHPQHPHPNALISSSAAAAAAMFTPLSLRTYLASTAAVANPLTAITTAPAGGLPGTCTQLLPPPSHQQPNQPNTPSPQLTCVPSSTSPQNSTTPSAINLNVDVVAMRHHVNNLNVTNGISIPSMSVKKAKLETKALKAKRPGFTDERYHETSYYIENGLRKVYPYYFTFTTFTKGRWVGEKILDVFSREFRAHPAEEYERCIKSGTLTVNYEKVPVDYRLKHNDLLANIVHRHEVPVTSQPITIVHMDDDIVVVNKPASIPVHPCGRYRHNTVVFILAKEYNLKNLRTIHRLDRLTSGLLLFGRSPKKARQMEHQIRNRQVQKEYICRVEGNFPEGVIECTEPIEVVSYKIGVCKVSPKGKDCTTKFQKISYNGQTSVVLCKPLTGRMHQIRVHLQYLGYPVVNDPLYNHDVFGPLKGRGGDIGGKTDDELVRDLINIHNAENWLGIDGDSDMSIFKSVKSDCDADALRLASAPKVNSLSDNDSETASRGASPVCTDSPRIVESSPNENVNDPQEMHSDNLCVNSANLNSVTSMAAIEKEDIVNCNSDGTINGKRQSANLHIKVTVATQTGHESPDMAFNAEKMTTDKHCYECKVRYRDPKPKDLVMYLHAWTYKGPAWEYETELPSWAKSDWIENDHD
ncbi:rluA pseudouridine synthase 1 isoform 2-T7 [Glossina fuscipes fuscipes]